MNISSDPPRRYYSPSRTSSAVPGRPGASSSIPSRFGADSSNVPDDRSTPGAATVFPYDVPARTPSAAAASYAVPSTTTAGGTGSIGLTWSDGYAAGTGPQAAYDRTGPPFRAGGLAGNITVDTTCRNIIACTSASGGVGLSTFAAMLAHRLAERSLPSALVDADFSGGGMDMLIGLENEEGERFETLDVPLGRLEGEALNHELPEWDGVRVLSFDPWNGPTPNWWQAQAAVRALAEANHAVVVDAGRGDVLHGVAEIGEAAQLVVVELSVLGLARASGHIGRLRERIGDSEDADTLPFVVGVAPRGTAKGAGMVDVREAADYLGLEIAGPVKADRRLCSDMLSGLGIRSVGRATRRTVDRAADWAEGLLGSGKRMP